ncbi:MAG: sulfatase [Verrucomicrobiales bacterium VVV1]|nr:MAG: sulfatase [Verrucomicrobiales bacterium VVV1]
MRLFLSLLPLLCWCLSLAPGFSAPDRKPNIVFILIDDMGATDGGCFGSKFYDTPELNSLASQSMRFTSAYASCAVCSPTRAAIQTGKAPARLHLTDWISGEGAPKTSKFKLPDWQKNLPLAETTLAEVLKKAGYATGHIGKWHLGGEEFFPQKQGFDLNIAGGHTGHPASFFWPYGPEKNSHRVPGLSEAGGKDGEYLTDRLTDEALHFIDSNKEKPFYLNLAHYAVHTPIEAKQAMIDEAAKRPASNGQGNATYAAMLKSVDESVGRILRKLDELKLGKDTIIIFTSDNGGVVHAGTPVVTSNFPLRKGKGHAYEGGLRVPLLIKVPGVAKPGSTCDVPVISTDFFPTLVELIGLNGKDAATALDGVSICPLLRGETKLPRTDLFWHYPHYWNGGKVNPYSVVRSGDWKLIRFYETGKEELYDLKADPSEQHDLSESNPENRAGLAKRLDAWLAGVGAQMPVPR